MSGVEVKEVKVFTRDNPCTKVDLWNCFRPKDNFEPRPVVEARGEIGLNAPKYLLREGYAMAYTMKGIDYYELTTTGQQWLTRGLVKHLEKHPDDIGLLRVKLAIKKPARRISRTVK